MTGKEFDPSDQASINVTAQYHWSDEQPLEKKEAHMGDSFKNN